MLFGEWVRKSITGVNYTPKSSQKFQILNLSHVHPGYSEDFKHSYSFGALGVSSSFMKPFFLSLLCEVFFQSWALQCLAESDALLPQELMSKMMVITFTN